MSGERRAVRMELAGRQLAWNLCVWEWLVQWGLGEWLSLLGACVKGRHASTFASGLGKGWFQGSLVLGEYGAEPHCGNNVGVTTVSLQLRLELLVNLSQLGIVRKWDDVGGLDG